MDLSKTELIHVPTGNTGIFIKEFHNYYGCAVLIKLNNGREYYAPKHEFKDLKTGQWI